MTCPNRAMASAPLKRRFRLPERFKGETQLLEHKSWMCFLLFFLPVDKERRSLLVTATFPVSREQRCKVQPCKGAQPLSGGRAIFYIYQLSKETAGLAVCWQRESTPFLCCTSLQTFTGTKHKRHSFVICLWSLKICKSLIKFIVTADRKLGAVWGYYQSTNTTAPCSQMFS